MNGTLIFVSGVFGIIPGIFVAQAIVQIAGDTFFSETLIFLYCFICVSMMIIGVVEKDVI
jgi:hypothetical protein